MMKKVPQFHPKRKARKESTIHSEIPLTRSILKILTTAFRATTAGSVTAIIVVLLPGEDDDDQVNIYNSMMIAKLLDHSVYFVAQTQKY